jgi:hypothetical protein
MILYLNESIVNEAVEPDKVIDAINNRNAVLINYADEEASHPGVRYVEPYVFGLTKAGNPCFRAYQYWGDTKRGVPKWKLFRLDRVESWNPTNNTFDLEPNARGWAAEAFNNNGDGSMSAVYNIVKLDDAPLTDYEKLKARTKQIKNNMSVNINDINKTNNKGPVQNVQPTEVTPNPQPTSGNNQKQEGPISNDYTNPNDYSSNDLMNNDDFKKMLQRNIEYSDRQKKNKSNTTVNQSNVTTANDSNKSPIKQEPQQSGPIVGDTTNPDDNKANDLMSNDDFKKMLQRNIEITNKDRARRNKKRY